MHGMYIFARRVNEARDFPYTILILHRGVNYHQLYSGISKVRKVVSSCRELVLLDNFCFHGAFSFDSSSGCDSL